MKSIKGFALGLTLGLAASIATVGIAQNTKPVEQDKKAESCCSMASSCCGDSCQMKDHAKNQSDKGGCCCCGGDSCDMKMMEKHKQ